ncbi:hypothetical protein [Haloterrigena alkaliphila]|uniref:Uncharacterized protein n=1 Tax=Haloterrigena alkaliphila TaxID=2816475 RepID=A0A8A2VEY9_9EURY|nr:hypothetical protein [Haloterrigena alkaliphila]QSW98922.1 hypothetical protein J0X25_16285 [Haloterrigena alkaliphila]
MSGTLGDAIGECTTVYTATGDRIDMPVWILNAELQDVSLEDNGDGIAYRIEEDTERTEIVLDETERGITVSVETQSGDGDTDVERVNEWYFDFIGIAVRRLYEECGVGVKGLSFGLTAEDFDPCPNEIT